MKFQSRTPLSLSSHTSILWFPVGALAALQGTFTLSWVVYRAHLPGMLTQFSFSADFAPKLLIIEALLAIVIEPLAGIFSDRAQQQKGSRFPIIWLGIGLTAALSIGIPFLVSGVEPIGAIRWALPALLLLWGIASSLARTPAIALLRHYSSTQYLPIAASLLTFAGGIAGAAAPLAKSSILSLGAILTFVAIAVLLLGITAVLQSNPSAPSVPASDTGISPQTGRSLWKSLSAIFGLGFGSTFIFRLIIETVPKLLQAQQLSAAQISLLLGLIFIALALAAFLAGKLALRFGNRRIMIVGLGGLAVGLCLMAAISSTGMAVIAALVVAISYSLIANGTLPLTLSLLSSGKAGLAIGIFFSGVSLAVSLFGLFGAQLSQPSTLIGWGGAGLLLTGLCIGVSHPSLSDNARVD